MFTIMDQPFIVNENIPFIKEQLELLKKINKVIIKCNFEYIHSLPDNIECITIMSHSDFNQPLENLPFNLKILNIYDDTFNQSLDSLPVNLEKLVIGSKTYNKPLDNLPSNLKILYFIRFVKYNQPLTNLPNSIEKITVYTYYKYKEQLKNLYPNANIEITDW
jgi:hypothetical protein